MRSSLVLAVGLAAAGAAVAIFDPRCDEHAACSNARDAFHDGADYAGGTYAPGLGTIVAFGTAFA